jgi:hypothetical protein
MALKPGDIVELIENYNLMNPKGTIGWIESISPSRHSFPEEDDLLRIIVPMRGDRPYCECYARRVKKIGEAECQ